MANPHPTPFPWLQHCVDADHISNCISPQSWVRISNFTQHLHLERYFQCNMSKTQFTISPHKPLPLLAILSWSLMSPSSLYSKLNICCQPLNSVDSPSETLSLLFSHLNICDAPEILFFCCFFFHLRPHLLALETVAVAR